MNKIKAFLAVLMPVAFVGILYLLFVPSITLAEGVKDVLLILLGTLIVLVKEIYADFFSMKEEKKE
jgi:hypothetical protein